MKCEIWSALSTPALISIGCIAGKMFARGPRYFRLQSEISILDLYHLKRISLSPSLPNFMCIAYRAQGEKMQEKASAKILNRI